MKEKSLNDIYNNLKEETFYPLRIKRIRAIYNSTQMNFAMLIGVKYNTLRNWECGHRYPSSAGCAILKVAEEHPNIFIKDREVIINQINNNFGSNLT